jgi:gliding motility-associated-like protein
MKTNCVLIFFLLLTFFCSAQSAVPNFSIPDTVCVNTPVSITNTSTGASTYYWNFCVADINTPPVGNNLGNIDGTFSGPVFFDYVFDGTNYYGFQTNNWSGNLIRLDFGNSLLNTPVATNLGSVGGVIPKETEGIQVVKNEGKWYAIIIGGDPTTAGSSIARIEFGANIANNSPTGINWGNIGNLSYPHDLYLFEDNGNWYGLTVNAKNNTITRFNFTSSFSNLPRGTNLGNLVNLNYPTGICAIKENNNWYAFVGSADNSTLTRLNFGSSLLNTPTAQNLGNINGAFRKPWDIQILKYCQQNVGFVIDAETGELLRLDFGSSITNTPTISRYGNIGNLNFPHCLSRIFRVGPDLYTFVSNVNTGSLSRIKFSGCTNASIPNSYAQNPPAVTYSTLGTYNINLTVDDGLPSQGAFCRQVVVLPSPIHSPTKNLTICNGESIKIGSSIKPAKYLWSTGEIKDSIIVNTSGIYWVESDRYGCSVRDSFIVSYSRVPIDFAFQQDICFPKTVQFSTKLTGAQSYSWNFGDGQTSNNSFTPATTYEEYGSYQIKLNVKFPSGCIDSLVKQITIENNYDGRIVLNNDTTICLGDSVLLRTANNSCANYCWKTSAGTAPPLLSTYVKPAIFTTYTLTSQVIGQNLVTNPAFSLGNTGFSSEYSYATSNTTEGEYGVGINPVAWNPSVSYCHDHTSGSGNMLMINGSPKPGVKVWSQSFSVAPNTDYNFSVWISSLHNNNPGNLYFAINDAELGNNINAGLSTCQWKQFFSTWNSGSNTTATISIVNNNTIADGNDFALDDIFFGEVTTRTDSVTVNVVGLCDSVKIAGKDKVCSPSDTLTYSIYKSANCTQEYSIQVDNLFATIVSQTSTSLKVVFKRNGTTTIKAAYANNCKIVADSIDVLIKFSPTSINFGPDIATCRDTALVLNAGDGFMSYVWQDGSKDSTFTIRAPGNYNVVAQDFCGVQLKDTIRYIKTLVTPFTVSPLNPKICEGDSVQFIANGGTTYLWSPARNFSRPTSASTNAIVNTTQNLTVAISDSICRRDTTIIVPVIASPGANISITKSNDVNCSNDSASLLASGGVSYTWSPDLFISKRYANKVTVKPSQTTIYTVKGKNEVGCVGTDSVTVFFFKTGDQKLFMPTAFTPNGDGKNDVFRPTFIGPSVKFDFSIYNRWGQLVFRSKVPGVGWDGTMNGDPQNPDIYVFYITAEGGCNGKFEQKGTFSLIR